MADDWKQHHANESDKAWQHPIVTRVIEEYASNMGFDPKVGLPAYGVMKVAMYAAQVARAQALGIDPELLRLTAQEANSEVLRLAAEAALSGIPVHVIEEDK